MLRPYKGTHPRVHPTAYVDASAQVIGDVEIGEASSVWMNVVIRGDVHRIRIGRRSNVQDGTIVHVMRGTHATTIGDDVTIGHGAIVHGCTLHDRILVGMGAILLNGVEVGEDSIVAAGTLLPEGTQIPPRSLVMGSPGKVRRAADRRRRRDDSGLRGALRGLPDRLHGRRRLRPGALMASQQTRPARGMRDFLPEDVRRRDYVIGVIAGVYRRYGFEPLETPALENIETLTGKYGEEGNKLIFKVLRRGEHESSGRDRSGAALRSDGPARARRRRVSREAAEVLQALPDPARVARRPAGARPLPRVLPVRRGRDRIALDGRRDGIVRGGQRSARGARLSGLRHPPQSSERPDRDPGDGRRAGRACMATRSSRWTSSTRSASRALRWSSRRGRFLQAAAVDARVDVSSCGTRPTNGRWRS